jgi:hypothetical protein
LKFAVRLAQGLHVLFTMDRTLKPSLGQGSNQGNRGASVPLTGGVKKSEPFQISEMGGDFGRTLVFEFW